MRAPLTFVGEKYRKVTAVYPATDNQSCTCKLNLGRLLNFSLTKYPYDDSVGSQCIDLAFEIFFIFAVSSPLECGGRQDFSNGETINNE
jgi:hypothetical protein